MATITTNEDREENAIPATRTAGDEPPTAHQAIVTPYSVWAVSVGLFHEEEEAEADPGRIQTRKPRITKTRLFQKPLTDLFIRRTNER